MIRQALSGSGGNRLAQRSVQLPASHRPRCALRMEEGDAKPLKILSPGDPVVEPDLDWGDAGIDASGGKDPQSGLPTVLHDAAGGSSW